jgi:large subunit ribosomal protein L6
MSRVGKQPIKVPASVKVTVTKPLVKIEGPKGKLVHSLPDGVDLKVNGDQLIVSVVEGKAPLHGLTRTLISNMVIGVSSGFSKELEIVGVGYRAQTKGSVLSLTLGYTHPIDYKLPEGIQVKVDGNTKITLTGADKMLLGLVAAKVRSFKAPEPYQGKGIKYSNEVIIRKQGKAAGAK